MRINLAELAKEHPLRNTPLAELRASYKLLNGREWKTVTPSWGIATSTYNQLGEVWTAEHTWEVDDGNGITAVCASSQPRLHDRMMVTRPTVKAKQASRQLPAHRF